MLMQPANSMDMNPVTSPESSESLGPLHPSAIRSRKRRRSEIESDGGIFDADITEQSKQQAPVDLGKGLIVSVLANEHNDASDVWNALRTSQIDDPFETSRVMSPVSPGIFSRARTLKSSFPSLNEALRLADIAFHTCYRLHEIVKRDDFREDISILYDNIQERDDFPYLDHCALLAAVIALAHALDADSHNATGCSKSLKQGCYYIRFAYTNLHVLDGSVITVTQLRTVILIILFQLFTSNAWASFPYLSLGCNTTVNLGLHARFTHSPTPRSDEDTPMQNLYWTVLYLDAYICGLLGMKPFFDLSGAKQATLTVMQHVAKNTSSIVRSPQELLFNVGLALSIELFDIQKRISDLQMQDVTSKKARESAIMNIQSLETELDDFKAVCDAIFPLGEVVNVVARTRFELLMGFCETCLLLAVQRKRFMATSKMAFIRRRDSNKSRTYSQDDAAILAVDTASEYMKLPEHAPFSEPAAYALFVSVLSLTAAMSATNASEKRLLFATKILEGFFLMTRIACPSFAATSVYLRYIYKFGHRCGAIPGLGGSPNLTPEIVATVEDLSPLDLAIDWESLPGDLILDQDLLSIPQLHSLSQAQAMSVSEPQTVSNRSTSATTSQDQLRSGSSAASTSVPPTLFSHSSSSASETTPISSASMTPVHVGRKLAPKANPLAGNATRQEEK